MFPIFKKKALFIFTIAIVFTFSSCITQKQFDDMNTQISELQQENNVLASNLGGVICHRCMGPSSQRSERPLWVVSRPSRVAEPGVPLNPPTLRKSFNNVNLKGVAGSPRFGPAEPSVFTNSRREQGFGIIGISLVWRAKKPPEARISPSPRAVGQDR